MTVGGSNALGLGHYIYVVQHFIVLRELQQELFCPCVLLNKWDEIVPLLLLHSGEDKDV